MTRPQLIVFASGTAEGGGSGFENLVIHSRSYAERTPKNSMLSTGQARNDAADTFDYDVAAVVSNHEHGGVRRRADQLDVPFIYFDPNSYPNVLENIRIRYAEIVHRAGAEWVALSGWLRKVEGLRPARTSNIHPALLSQLGGKFGGKGMYGHRIHEAVKAALDAGEIIESGFTMHFVTDEMDRGPIFFERRVPLTKNMSADDIATAVNKEEHRWQPKLTNMVVHGEIRWDGKDPRSLVVPKNLGID